MNKIFWIFIFISYSTYASDTRSTDALYYSGEFDKVIEIYQDEIESGRASSFIYYNLATSYYRKAMKAEAALYYLKAYGYNPYDKALDENLSTVLGGDVNPGRLFFEPLDLFFMRPYLGTEQRELVFPTSLVIFFCVLGLHFRKILFSKVWPILAGFFIFYAAAVSFFDPWPELAVVAEDNVSVYSEPSEKVGVELFSLPLLSIVRVVERRPDWILIQVTDQRKAWVTKEKLALED